MSGDAMIAEQKAGQRYAAYCLFRVEEDSEDISEEVDCAAASEVRQHYNLFMNDTRNMNDCNRK